MIKGSIKISTEGYCHEHPRRGHNAVSSCKSAKLKLVEGHSEGHQISTWPGGALQARGSVRSCRTLIPSGGSKIDHIGIFLNALAHIQFMCTHTCACTCTYTHRERDWGGGRHVRHRSNE